VNISQVLAYSTVSPGKSKEPIFFSHYQNTSTKLIIKGIKITLVNNAAAGTAQ
jgi:hypothetical protein